MALRSILKTLLSIFVDIQEEKVVFSPQDLTEHYRREIPHCVLDGVFVAAHYRDIDRIIEGYKYRSEREKARVLSDILGKLYLSRKKYLPVSDCFRHPEQSEGSRIESTETLDSSQGSEWPRPAPGQAHNSEWQKQVVICPVPMHWSRYLIRGFDHVAILGEQLAKEEHISFHRLLKAKYTKRQSKLQKSERVKNREHAFVQNSSIKKIPETVILIDDVISTGSTANACAKILKKAGVKYVYGFFLASNQ